MAILTREEYEGLTMWGEAISAQFRDGYLALLVQEGVATDDDGAARIPYSDLGKLRVLIEAAAARGEQGLANPGEK